MSTDYEKRFDEWLHANIARVQLERWGPTHTKIAAMFAADMAAEASANAVRSVLDEALNSGDGVYRP